MRPGHKGHQDWTQWWGVSVHLTQRWRLSWVKKATGLNHGLVEAHGWKVRVGFVKAVLTVPELQIFRSFFSGFLCWNPSTCQVFHCDIAVFCHLRLNDPWDLLAHKKYLNRVVESVHLFLKCCRYLLGRANRCYRSHPSVGSGGRVFFWSRWSQFHLSQNGDILLKWTLQTYSCFPASFPSKMKMSASHEKSPTELTLRQHPSSRSSSTFSFCVWVPVCATLACWQVSKWAQRFLGQIQNGPCQVDQKSSQSEGGHLTGTQAEGKWIPQDFHIPLFPQQPPLPEDIISQRGHWGWRS